MKISHKITGGFLLVSLLVIVISCINILIQEQLIRKFQRVAGEELPGTIAEANVQADLYHILAVTIASSPGPVEEREKMVDELITDLKKNTLVHDLLHRNYDIDRHVEIIQKTVDRFTSLVTEYMVLIKRGAGENDLSAVRGKIEKVIAEYQSRIEPVIREHLEDSRQRVETTRQDIVQAHRLILGSTAIIVVMSLALGLVISRLISTPLKKLAEGAARIGRGRLDTRLEIKSRDEIGVLARTLNKMAMDLQAITVSRDAFAQEVLERKKVEKALRENEEKLAGVVDSVTDSMIMLDERFHILWANKVAKRLFGANVVGRPCYQVYHGHSRPCEPCIAIECFTDGRIHEFETEIVTPEGHDMSVRCTANVAAWHEDGRPKVVVEFLGDITESKHTQDKIIESLKEKEVLLKEIHHRVKNNMQVISSLLRLRSSHITDKRDAEIFRESQNQIKSMALVHEKLYQSKDLADIDFSDYVRHLASALFRSYAVDVGRIRLRLDIEDVMLGIDAAIPCGLIINELVSNSLKYAFPGGKEGEVRIDLHPTGRGEVKLAVSDNGVGIPEGLDLSSTESLGLKLIRILAEQIGARLELDRAGGTTFRLTFNLA